MAKKAQGIVQNPRGIPEGTAIVSQVLSSSVDAEDVGGVLREVQTVRTAIFYAGDSISESDLSDWDGMVAREFVKVIEG